MSVAHQAMQNIAIRKQKIEGPFFRVSANVKPGSSGAACAFFSSESAFLGGTCLRGTLPIRTKLQNADYDNAYRIDGEKRLIQHGI